MEGQEKKMSSLKAGFNRLNSIIAIIVLIAVLVVVNIICGKLPWKYDMTIDKIFSLSDQTRNVIKDLKKEVNIVAFYQEGKEDATVKALLEEYVKAGRGKIKLEYSDAEKDPMTAKKYDVKNEGITNDSVVFESGGNIKRLTSSDIYDMNNSYGKSFSGEQQFTGALLYVTSPKLNKIYFLEGHQETSLTVDLFKLKSIIESEANITGTLNLLKEDGIPMDADVIVVVSPKRDLSTQEKEKLQDFLAKGGKALFMFDVLSDGTKMDNFGSIMKTYGIGLKNNFVVEENSNGFYSNNKMFLVPYYSNHSIVESLKSESMAIIFPYSMNLEILNSNDKNLSLDAFLQTSKKSWMRYNIADASSERTANDVPGPANVAVAVTRNNIDDRLPETRLVVTGNAKFIEDNMLEIQGNVDLFMNSIKWIENKKESISIRPKLMNSNLMMVRGTAYIVLMIVSVLLVPIIPFGIGLIVWFRRRHS